MAKTIGLESLVAYLSRMFWRTVRPCSSSMGITSFSIDSRSSSLSMLNAKGLEVAGEKFGMLWMVASRFDVSRISFSGSAKKV